jgi:hypothetical protein
MAEEFERMLQTKSRTTKYKRKTRVGLTSLILRGKMGLQHAVLD